MRIRTIDACLRRRQRLWTIEDLREACEDALYEYEGIPCISTRTIQRDIELMRSDKLGYNAPIVVRDRKYYTYDDPDYSITQMPLSKEDLAHLASAMDIIRHYGEFKGMDGQEDILTRMQDRIQSQSSHQSVIFIETNKRLRGLNYLGVLYEHIVAKEPIEVAYKSFKSRDEVVYYLSPYLLKEYNNRWFLFSYNVMMERIQNIALDRIVSVRKDVRHNYQENRFFEPETFLGEMVGVTREIDSATETVTVKVAPRFAPYVATKPIHDSQQLLDVTADGYKVFALNVIINQELISRLLSYGPDVEVISPSTLRDKIAQLVARTAGLYATSQD